MIRQATKRTAPKTVALGMFIAGVSFVALTFFFYVVCFMEEPTRWFWEIPSNVPLNEYMPGDHVRGIVICATTAILAVWFLAKCFCMTGIRRRLVAYIVVLILFTISAIKVVEPYMGQGY